MEGMELEIERTAGRWPGYYLSLSTLSAREVDTGEDLDFRPSLRLSVGLDQAAGPLRAYLTCRYTGTQHYKRKDQETGETVRETVPDYLLLESRLAVDLSGYGEFSFAIDNLLNEEYLVEGHQQATPVLPGRGREFTIGYSMQI